MRVNLIVAVAENGVIGDGGQLPWHLPADLRRFKRVTMGHALIMGRKTFESIGRPLPGRRSIVLTRQPHFNAAGAIVAGSLQEALAAAAEEEESFVIGGEEVFRLALPRCRRLFVTRVHAAVAGDVHFPAWNPHGWRLVDRAEQAADERNEYACSFEVYEHDGQDGSLIP